MGHAAASERWAPESSTFHVDVAAALLSLHVDYAAEVRLEDLFTVDLLLHIDPHTWAQLQQQLLPEQEPYYYYNTGHFLLPGQYDDLQTLQPGLPLQLQQQQQHQYGGLNSNASADAYERDFEREHQTAQSRAIHQGNVYEVSPQHPHHYISSEYVSGPSQEQFRQRGTASQLAREEVGKEGEGGTQLCVEDLSQRGLQYKQMHHEKATTSMGTAERLSNGERKPSAMVEKQLNRTRRPENIDKREGLLYDQQHQQKNISTTTEHSFEVLEKQPQQIQRVRVITTEEGMCDQGRQQDSQHQHISEPRPQRFGRMVSSLQVSNSVQERASHFAIVGNNHAFGQRGNELLLSDVAPPPLLVTAGEREQCDNIISEPGRYTGAGTWLDLQKNWPAAESWTAASDKTYSCSRNNGSSGFLPPQQQQANSRNRQASRSSKDGRKKEKKEAARRCRIDGNVTENDTKKKNESTKSWLMRAPTEKAKELRFAISNTDWPS